MTTEFFFSSLDAEFVKNNHSQRKMNNSVPHPLIPDSAISLGNSVIRYFHARREDENAELPEMDDRYLELFAYPWNPKTINLLEQLLKTRRLNSDFYRRQYDAFLKLVEQGDADLFYLLLQHSFLNVKTLEDYPEVNYSTTEENRYVVNFWNYSREYRYGRMNYFCRIYEPICHFPFLKKLENYTCMSPMRLRKVLWGLGAVIVNFNSTPPARKAWCLKTLYEFTREPYITSAEIVSIVKHIGGQNISNFTLAQIRTAFEEYFPESKQVYQPRSLQHLCFYQIRENLSNVGRFPDGVQQLPIPNILKEWVVPDKPAIVSAEGIPLFKFSDRLHSIERIPEESATRLQEVVATQWWD